VLDRVLSIVRPAATERFFDIGCGRGRYSLMLARRGHRVCAVDFSDVIDEARSAVARAGLAERVSVERASVLALPFADGSAEHLLCMHVLLHVPKIERALDELARVLRPGGTLTIADNNRASPESRLRETYHLVRRRLGLTAGEPRPDGFLRWVPFRDGQYLDRTIDVDWLVAECKARGLALEARFPRKYTEYAVWLVPASAGRHVVHAFNDVLFRLFDYPRLAFQNVLVFRKAR